MGLVKYQLREPHGGVTALRDIFLGLMEKLVIVWIHDCGRGCGRFCLFYVCMDCRGSKLAPVNYIQAAQITILSQRFEVPLFLCFSSFSPPPPDIPPPKPNSSISSTKAPLSPSNKTLYHISLQLCQSS